MNAHVKKLNDQCIKCSQDNELIKTAYTPTSMNVYKITKMHIKDNKADHYH